MSEGSVIPPGEIGELYQAATSALREELEDTPADPLEFLVTYAWDRAGIRKPADMKTWVRDMYMRSQQSGFGGQTSGNRLRDLASYLKYVDQIANGRQGENQLSSRFA